LIVNAEESLSRIREMNQYHPHSTKSSNRNPMEGIQNASLLLRRGTAIAQLPSPRLAKATLSPFESEKLRSQLKPNEN
jgi:hypothetical protein